MTPAAPGRLTWVGHATVLIELAGLRVLTDPLLRGRVAHLRRHAPVPEPPGRLDAILLSHLHHDHADGPSLRRLPRCVPAVVPAGTGRAVRRLSRRSVIELATGERTPLGTGSVSAVPAEHDGRRYPAGRRVPAVGYVVENAGLRVYFAGDTGEFAGMADLGALDAALLPIWGWGPSLGPGHLDPLEAARAAALIRPGLVVPIHWATYLPIGYVADHPLLQEPGATFAAAVHDLAPSIPVAVLSPGESVELPVVPERRCGAA
jgi:L-ascorbate metabolism protein UlaG (beta-lactamase superfamily)